jgi:exosome complex component RRP4
MEQQLRRKLKNKMAKEERQLVTPGEVIINDSEYLPGEGTEKRGEEIIAQKFGLVEISNRLVRIIPLSGTYIPRRGNVVIGEVRDITFNGWLIDIGAPSSLSLIHI